MGLLSKFKLQRLTIYAWSARARSGITFDKFTVQYNPSSLQMSHQNVFEELQGINTSGREARYSYSRSETLSVDLVIDGSGARAGDDPAEVTLTATAEVFEQILAGELNPTAAFMSGRLSVDGDMGAAMRLGSLLA